MKLCHVFYLSLLRHGLSLLFLPPQYSDLVMVEEEVASVALQALRQNILSL
jgi:hypothetical protein